MHVMNIVFRDPWENNLTWLKIGSVGPIGTKGLVQEHEQSFSSNLLTVLFELSSSTPKFDWFSVGKGLLDELSLPSVPVPVFVSVSLVCAVRLKCRHNWLSSSGSAEYFGNRSQLNSSGHSCLYFLIKGAQPLRALSQINLSRKTEISPWNP